MNNFQRVLENTLKIIKNPSGWLAAYIPEAAIGLVAALFTLLVIVIAYKITIRITLRAMRRQHRTVAQTKQVANLLKYTFGLGGLIFVLASMSASLVAIGLTAGFITMILGWSLQRPVTGVAAWLMVMIKRPFVIGDRIIIQGVRGDVLDISPTHILLGEVGGTIGGEESSNRGILIPNAILFDQMVINYAATEETKYMLTETNVRVSYNSDYKLAIETLINAAKTVTPDIIAETGREPIVRSEFFDSGVMMRLRYQTLATEREHMASEIVGQIVEAFAGNDKLGFAYPHSAVEFTAVDKSSLPPMFKQVDLKEQVG
jgi:small-conductance mechanosensitive channel